MWTTDHRINRTVTAAAIEGLRRLGYPFTIRDTKDYNGKPVPSLSYGVLRGTGRIYQDCEREGIDWWNIDKGFFRPGHFDGFYRIGYRHLQPLFIKERTEHPSRWKRLGIPVSPWRRRAEGIVLVCPPEGICDFYGIDQREWLRKTLDLIPDRMKEAVHVRYRTTQDRLSVDLDRARCVLTHSSNVAMEALIQGIPAVAETGMVHSWNRMTFDRVGEDQEGFNRKALFVQAANAQFTLDEFRSGYAWTSTVNRQVSGEDLAGQFSAFQL